jgi:hypothetical protein
MTEYHDSPVDGLHGASRGSGDDVDRRSLSPLSFLIEIEPALRGMLRDLTPTSDTIESAICDACGIITRSKPSSETLAAAMNAAKARTERNIADHFVHMLRIELVAPSDLSEAGRRANVTRLSRVPGQRFGVVEGDKP